jgi:tetratricopeptide (TPR) repeat protein
MNNTATRILITILLIFTSSCYYASEEARVQIINGNESYANGNFEQARDYYERAIDKGVNNGHLHYNLANTYYRLGMIGKAITHYHHARAMLPRNTDISSNLEFVRGQARDKLEYSSGSLGDIAASVVFSPRKIFSLGELKIISLLIASLFTACFILSAWAVNSLNMFARHTSVLLLIYLLVVIYCSEVDSNGKSKFSIINSKPSFGVVVVESTNGYSSYSESVQAVFVLNDGAEVSVGDVRDNWVQVELPTGRKGWIERKNIELI